MIIWINGAFGSGKSSVAEAISRELKPSFIYDPEQVGYFLWDCFPDELKRKGDFQHIKIWREFNCKILKHIYDNYSGTIIVPMTIYIKQYYDEVIGKLISDGVNVKHFILMVTKQTVIDRLVRRGDTSDGWAAQRYDVCSNAFETTISREKLVADEKTVDEVAADILDTLS